MTFPLWFFTEANGIIDMDYQSSAYPGNNEPKHHTEGGTATTQFNFCGFFYDFINFRMSRSLMFSATFPRRFRELPASFMYVIAFVMMSVDALI